MAAATANRPRTALTSASARRWLKTNLFSSLFNTVLTLVTLAFIVFGWLIGGAMLAQESALSGPSSPSAGGGAT